MSHNASHRRDTEKIAPSSRSLLHQSGMLWERAQLLRSRDTDAAPSSRLRTLLVPLDGTPIAEHALPHALAIARRSGAVVRLVHVHSRLDHSDAWQMYPSDETLERRKQEKHAYLREVAERIARVGSFALETILIESFDTEESLLTAAQSADMVVMASRRRGFFSRLFSHSVSDELRRRLRVPVLLVRGYDSPADLTSDPFARHVLVALDGSSLAERILAPVKTVRALETQPPTLTLLNVQDRDWTNGAFEHTTPQGYLIGTAHGFNEAPPRVEAAIMTTDKSMTAALASYAKRHQADWIALAIRADGGWNRRLRGSAVDSLLRQTDLPILTMSVDVEQRRSETLSVVGV